jgi:GNAT superfamily N-acetyltransferase
MAVHPSFHSRGIGTKLLNHAKQHVAAEVQDLHGLDGEVLMNVHCFEKNPRALQFYERGGFVRSHGVGELDEKVQEYLALLVWSK